MVRASNVVIGTLALVVIAVTLGGWLGYRRYAGATQQVLFRVIFDGPASGLRRGGSVNFAGVRIGEVVSIRLDRHRVIAMTRIESTAPIKKDTQVGLEFQGLTGIAAISFTGGTDMAPLPPKGPDGVMELTADPEGTMGIQERLRVVLRNVDTALTTNEVAIHDTLQGLETFTAALSDNSEKVSDFIEAAESGVSAVDDKMTRTQAFLKSLGSDKYDGELLPTIISLRELIESFDKKSTALMSDTRKMLGDISDSVNKADRKFGGPGRSGLR